MEMERSLAILNLSGELSPELSNYFSARNILVVDPLNSSETTDWTHIITKDIHNFDMINKTYDLFKNDCHIISLSKVNDLQNFTVNNGNLVLDEAWLKGDMGNFILDKYFQGYGGVTLGDNYPSFDEQGSFNIANPFNTGEYLDQMVQRAFENGVEALSIKTYFDHLVMYIAGLKNKGKAGLPIEVTYGSYENIFAIQIHFFSNQLEILDVTTCLSSTISKKPEEYYLNTAVQSADFFDFAYVPEVNKAVVTALWTKEERITFENRGLMFMSLVGGEVLTRYKNEGQTISLIQKTHLLDFTEKVTIPASLPDDSYQLNFTETPSAKEESTTVGGYQEPTDDEARLINGDHELAELVNTVKGKMEQEESIVRLAGNKIDVDQVVYKIAATVDESNKENKMEVRTLGNKLPDKIKTGLFDFAKGLLKDVETLDDHEISRFQVEKLPDIILSELTYKPSEEDKFKPVSGGQGPTATREGQEKLEAQVHALNAENHSLKNQIKMAENEIKLLREAKSKMAEIKKKAAEAAAQLPEPTKRDDPDSELRKHFHQKANEKQSLNDQDMNKLGSLMEREMKLIETIREEELKSRKIQIEALQKENYFNQELEKAQKEIRSRDTVINKTKETFTNVLEKRDREVIELRQKTDQLSRALANGPSKAQNTVIKELERYNQNLSKQVEVYKAKLSSVSENIQSTKTDDGNYKEEARKLQMSNTQLKYQLDQTKKEFEKWTQKYQSDNSTITSLRQEKARLEQILKKTTLSMVTDTSVSNGASEQELKRMQSLNQILEVQVKESGQRILGLEAKLAELQKMQKTTAVPEDSNKVKLAQLEGSTKKLTQDLMESKAYLSEAKKEVNKLRQEKTALQNQLDKMKKDAEKAKPAAPKKPGGKAA